MPLEEAKKAQFIDSGFVVGVQIMSNEFAGPVWAIFNGNPKFDVTGERRHVQNEDSWGCLPDSTNEHKQISIAKMANSVNDLGWERRLKWADKKEYQPQLVPVVRGSNDTLIRQKVSPV